MTIIEQLEKDFGHAVSPSDKADYQFACFNIAKAKGKKPLDVANEMAREFKSKVARVEVSPPGFLNFYITDEALEKIGADVLKSGKLPLPAADGRTVFFDYGGANVAKELHIGHLRSPIIGEALRRVFEAFGHKTISCTYLGDWGLQRGLVIAELEGQDVDITLDMLNEVYPRASKRKELDEEFKKRAEDITKRLQDLEEPYFSIWKKMRAVSVEKIRENYETLGCRFDYYNGESNAQEFVDQILDDLQKKGVAYIDKDCLIMDVKEESDTGPMPPILLKKGNGGDLYATSDVVTIWKRFGEHKPHEFVYITDARQELHFKQVFRAVKKGSLVPCDTKLTHIGYGTINGADGKPFKTRSGGTIKLEDVINMVTDAAQKKLSESGRVSDYATAQKIGLAALKFADLSSTVRKDYIFDIDAFTSFEGKTGPYLLYTVARINSVLEKFDGMSQPLQLNRPIFTAIIRLAESFSGAAQNYTLNGIVDATYNLAQEFNNFYANHNIIKGGHTELARLVKTALVFALDKLGIDTVEKM